MDNIVYEKEHNCLIPRYMSPPQAAAVSVPSASAESPSIYGNTGTSPTATFSVVLKLQEYGSAHRFKVDNVKKYTSKQSSGKELLVVGVSDRPVDFGVLGSRGWCG